jgi:hypothetical protein
VIALLVGVSVGAAALAQTASAQSSYRSEWGRGYEDDRRYGRYGRYQEEDDRGRYGRNWRGDDRYGRSERYDRYADEGEDRGYDSDSLENEDDD